jgi:hypothetical protein
LYIAPEKRKKLENQAVEGHVVGHLDKSKGWTFWMTKTKKLVSLAWADFGQECLPTTTPLPEANNLELSNFKEEENVIEKEANVDTTNQVFHNNAATTPSTFKQAMMSSEAPGWKASIRVKLENLQRKSVWQVLKIPAARQALGARWVFTKKKNTNGSVRYKACYLAKGFNQNEGTNYAHTFAPTAAFTSMRILLTIAAKNHWPIYNFDFVAAYLNAPIYKEVWVRLPEGLKVGTRKACLLNKVLYGTKQAAHCWWKHLSATLVGLGYTSSYYSLSVYTLTSNKDKSIIWVHIDEGIETGSSDAALRRLEKELKGSLEIKWNKGLTSIVGVNIHRTTQGFEIHQPKRIQKILSKQWEGTTRHSTLLPEGFNSHFIPRDLGAKSTKYFLIIGSLTARKSGLDGCIQVYIGCGHPIQTWARATK